MDPITRALRATVLALYAASLAAAVLALCPCPMVQKADAHDCCARAGVKAATSDCCRGATLQAKAPAVPGRAGLSAPAAPRALAPGIPLRVVAVAPRSAAPARSPSPPSVLRI